MWFALIFVLCHYVKISNRNACTEQGDDVIKSKKPKKQIINIITLVVLIGVTFYTIFHTSDGFSPKAFVDFVSSIEPMYMFGAFLCMFLFIFFEGEALHVLVKKIGHKQNRLNTFVYSSADIYFSAITPSATGGQPASAYYMHEDGISISASSAVLSYNILMYTASLIVMTIITFAFRFNLFLSLDFWPKFFVVAGVVIQSVILAGFLLIMISEKAVLAVVRFAVNIMCKLRIKKNKDELISDLSDSVHKFKLTVKTIGNSKMTALKVFLLNFLQRISILGISVFVFFGAGIEGASVVDVFALQALCLIGSNSVPIPGAVGVSEWLYLSAFSSFMSSTTLVSAMMATRGVSYYICFIFAGIVTLARHIRLIFKKDNHRYD